MAEPVTDDPLLLSERAKYAAVWADERYRSNAWGLDLWRRRRGIFPSDAGTALDIGCGHGRLMAAWLAEGIDAYGVDLVDALDPAIREAHGSRLTVCPLWDYTGGPFDLGVAADVLEHLPEELVEASLQAMAKACKVVVAQTAEYESADWDGNPLHLTIRPMLWWRAAMRKVGGTVTMLPIERRPNGEVHLLRWQPAR